mmetsp:Transcript_14748/g.22890  ORF Transcript_14748/g.22890 Transcript_14748/m.22890 type:complete len:84 (+) Transcript_14748:1544-1795(+)
MTGNARNELLINNGKDSNLPKVSMRTSKERTASNQHHQQSTRKRTTAKRKIGNGANAEQLNINNIIGEKYTCKFRQDKPKRNK